MCLCGNVSEGTSWDAIQGYLLVPKLEVEVEVEVEEILELEVDEMLEDEEELVLALLLRR